MNSRPSPSTRAIATVVTPTAAVAAQVKSPPGRGPSLAGAQVAQVDRRDVDAHVYSR